MLAGLLLALFLLVSGQETFMLNPEMEKSIKTTVKDKERKHQIDQILKEIKQDQKLFLKKTQKPSLKKLEELNLEYTSTAEDYQVVLNSYFTDLGVLQNKYLDKELQIRSLTKEEEWNKIMEMVIEKPNKEKHKKEIDKMCNQMHSNLLKAVEKNITDTISLKKARLLLEDYKTSSITISEKLLNASYKQNEAIRLYDTPRANFELLRLELLNSRKEYMSFVVAMRFQLKVLTPKENWKNVAKAINNNLKIAN
jgi:hypothetical protein